MAWIAQPLSMGSRGRLAHPHDQEARGGVMQSSDTQPALGT